jgi:hypothetical protein
VASGTDGRSAEINPPTSTTPRISTPSTTDTPFPRSPTLNTSATTQTHTRHRSLIPSLASVRGTSTSYSHGRRDSDESPGTEAEIDRRVAKGD